MKKGLLIIPLLALGCTPTVYGRIHPRIVEIQTNLSLEAKTPLWHPDFEKYIEDGNPALPAFIYDHILEKLNDLSRKEIRTRTGENFDSGKPEICRGKFWRIAGRIARIWPENITDSRSPVKKVFAGILFTEEGVPVLFHLVEKPEMLELGEDFVEIDGLFLKNMTFRDARGDPLSTPFFLAKSLRKLL